VESDRAINQAQHVLERLDAMEGEQVWESGTLLFKARYDKESWNALQQLRRHSYGVLLSRELRSINYKSSYYFSPDGHYFIVQFNSTFTNKQGTVETVILNAGNPTTWEIVDILLN